MADILTVNQYFEQLPENQRPLGLALRQLILETIPQLTESLKWGSPSYGLGGEICYLKSQKNHLNFGFYQGGLLPDPEQLLEGTGAKMRHRKIKSMDDICKEPLQALLREAVELQTAPKPKK